jgi:CBS domain-containing protein
MRENAVVTHVMSRPVVVIRDVDTLARGLEVLAIADLHHVVVVDVAGRYAGLLSDRTVAAAWLHYPMEFSRLSAGDLVAAPRQPVIDVDATVREAAFAMHGCGTDAVVVLDKQWCPVGVVTAADLVALIAAAEQEPATGPESAGDQVTVASAGPTTD